MPFYYNFRPAIPNEAFSKTFQAVFQVEVEKQENVSH